MIVGRSNRDRTTFVVLRDHHGELRGFSSLVTKRCQTPTVVRVATPKNPVKRAWVDHRLSPRDACDDGDRGSRRLGNEGCTGCPTSRLSLFAMSPRMRSRTRYLISLFAMFVPLTHPPGHAQVDFGEALAVIGTQDPLPGDEPTPLGRLLCEGLSGGDHGGLLWRPCLGVLLLRRCAALAEVATNLQQIWRVSSENAA